MCSKFLTLVLVSTALWVLACSSTPKTTEDEMTIASIPLQIFSNDPGTYLANIEITIDGQKKNFLLDTGAASSSIAMDDQTSKYPSLGASESKGASGQAKECDLIQPSVLEIGGLIVDKPELKRCDRNILGLDILSNFVFQVDFKDKALVLLRAFPTKTESFPVRRLSPGHATIPLKIETQSIDVLFDTGADSTVFDSQYIDSHPNLFKLVRSEDGFDAHGNKIPSKVYLINSIQVDSLTLNNVEVAAFNFGSHLREKMEGSQAILGNNVITKAKWNFDLKANAWTIEQYANEEL